MEPFLGMIAAFGFNFPPYHWALCQGQLLSVSQNSALFALLGVQYGGNGQTTFALPHLGGRTLVGTGQAPGISHNYQQGEVAGVESTTLTINQMPMHTHTPVLTNTSTSSQAGTAVAAAGDAITPLNNYLALSPKIGSGPNATQLKTYATAGTPVSLAGGAITTNTTTSGNNALAGGSQPFSIVQPYLAINYCIALVGIYPSRN